MVACCSAMMQGDYLNYPTIRMAKNIDFTDSLNRGRSVCEEYKVYNSLFRLYVPK